VNGGEVGSPAITVAGTGSLTPELLRDVTVVAGGKRQLRENEHLLSSEARRVELTANVGEAVQTLKAAAEAGERVVVLASGDPLLFGIGATLVRELGRERVRVVPGVSSVQLAFAAVGEPWHDATILSAHGRPLRELVPAALRATKMAILTDRESTPGALAEALLGAGMEDCRVVVCERLGYSDERITETTLVALAERDFDPLNVVLLFREASAVRLRFGRPDGQFEAVRGQITKAEVRAVTLSKLQLPPYGVLWDVGAGSGALSVEAAGLMPHGTVYAVERDPDQIECLRRNAALYGAANVRTVEGEAPAALEGLPKPDAVFLGGNGGGLGALLDAVPRPFVTNLAMIEHVSLVLQRFPDAEVTQIAAARSQPIGDGHRLAALNPVYIVSVPE
jgi:precorrin-6Y C5,15-methyltransferase (decarboxylating)